MLRCRIFRALLRVVTNMSSGAKLIPVESHWSSPVHYAPLGTNSSPLPNAWPIFNLLTPIVLSGTSQDVTRGKITLTLLPTAFPPKKGRAGTPAPCAHPTLCMLFF